MTPTAKRSELPWGVLFALAVALLLTAPAIAWSQRLPAPALTAPDRHGSAHSTEAQPPSLDEVRADIEYKLREALGQRKKLAYDSTEVKPPPGIDEEEVAEKRRLIDRLVFSYQAQLRTIVELKEVQKALADAEARGRTWPGFDEPPPYSILMVDQLADAVEGARGKVAALESSLALLQRDTSRHEDSAKRAASAVRLATDAAEQAKTPSEAAQLTWRREEAELRERAAQNFLALTNWIGKLTEAKLAAARAELALLERQYSEARNNANFTAADLQRIREMAKQNAKDLEQELQSSLMRSAKRSEEKDKAEHRFRKARNAAAEGQPNAPSAAELDSLEARLRTAETWLKSARFESEALSNLTAINRSSTEMWEHRYTLVNSRDPEKRRDALAQLRHMLERVKPWRLYLQDQLSLVRAEEQKQRARLDSLGADSPIRRFEQESLEAYLAQKTVIERLQALTDETERSLRRWLDEYKTDLKASSLFERLEDQLAAVAEWTRTLWDFELFTVEDSFELEGQTVKTRRGITFGKSLGAMILFVVGYWLSAVLARRLQRVLVLRWQIDEPVANVFRRWALVLFTVILLVMVLNIVRIPLTVFAFLGGALAIGIGFGTQTLLKNLISGVIVLIERKVKVGDIIELDGVVGTIIEVDIRSSTVRSFDGVETMVPNASFLEQRVTNWTYTNRVIRRTIKVGVSYGSPVRRVADILLDCAARHGLVLKDPKPFVWLENFADNAINFGLYFWVELGPSVNSFQIMSDVRFMIVEAFNKAGIVISFPQRDVHLDAATPVRVEVISPESGRREDKPSAKLGSR